jgi:predicted RNA binding protein YcfA (HicA-like mRNA interferase family)
VTKRDKRRELALRRPTSLPIADAIRFLADAGWEHRREGTSHHKFTKPGKRTLVIVERHGKVNAAAVADIVAAITEAEEQRLDDDT